FAAAFDRRTGPSGTCRRPGSAASCYYQLRTFAHYLAGVLDPPTRPDQLRPRHLDGYRDEYRDQATLAQRVGGLKAALRAMDGLDEAVLPMLGVGGIARDRNAKVVSYPLEDFRKIMNKARGEARATAAGIRAHRRLLARWRLGEIDQAGQNWELGRLLDHIESTGDIPRKRSGKGRVYADQRVFGHGRISDLIASVHLTWREAMPFLVLLVGMTGQNGGTIAAAPAAAHRPDGGRGTATGIVELVKPRRGTRSHMPVALTGLPDWLSADQAGTEVSARDELHTPLGVFLLMRELTEPVRRITGTDRLLAVRGRTGYRSGAPASPGLLGTAIARWGERAGLTSDASAGEPTRIEVSLPRLRLTAVEHRQQAIAHTDRVLANEYLGRDRGNLTAYQQLVAKVLADQVAKAKASAAMPVLTDVDLAEARVHPEQAAARFGMDADTFNSMLAGDLDTVLGACVDHRGGPHAPPGEPCRASFMRCLDCPCARATPRHLPVQVLVADALEARRADLPPVRWAQRFALPHAQLADLLSKHPAAAIERARAAAGDADRRLAERFLARELDFS
ncbi:MAG: hypothetical protein ACRDOL_38610, partial [Streptosporangiaceae bacterium]